MKLKPKKAAGLDRIPHKLVKNSAVIITPFLNHIFNISLSEEKFPDDWKKAKGKSQGSLFLGHTVCARCREEEPLTSAVTPVDKSVSDPLFRGLSASSVNNGTILNVWIFVPRVLAMSIVCNGGIEQKPALLQLF